MRTWVRALLDQVCGGPCRTRILTGQPMLVIEHPHVKRKLVRCAACADEPVPELPEALPTSARKLTPPPDFTRIGLLPLEFTRRLVLAREPGEEG